MEQEKETPTKTMAAEQLAEVVRSFPPELREAASQLVARLASAMAESERRLRLEFAEEIGSLRISIDRIDEELAEQFKELTETES